MFSWLNTQVTPQGFGPRITSEFGDGFVFDLANPLAGQAETVADIFQAHGMIHPDAKEETDDFLLPLGERFQGPVNIYLQGFIVLNINFSPVSIRIFHHIDEGIVLPFG